MEIKLGEKLKCKHCHHEWVPRVEDVAVCPNCQSPRWYKNKVIRQKKEK
ncbi:MAG: hypothetical protein GH144_00080 [Clostridia bacterium]|nr:hypothetical protein [Clostridia bacterium]